MRRRTRKGRESPCESDLCFRSSRLTQKLVPPRGALPLTGKSYDAATECFKCAACLHDPDGVYRLAGDRHRMRIADASHSASLWHQQSSLCVRASGLLLVWYHLAVWVPVCIRVAYNLICRVATLSMLNCATIVCTARSAISSRLASDRPSARSRSPQYSTCERAKKPLRSCSTISDAPLTSVMIGTTPQRKASSLAFG